MNTRKTIDTVIVFSAAGVLFGSMVGEAFSDNGRLVGLFAGMALGAALGFFICWKGY